jgi:ribosomal protein S18 acetylase RimI-like enzyme
MTSSSREATTSDLQAIVAVHEAAFAGFFLTQLGRGFLRQLYRSFIVEPDGICRVAEAQLTPGGREVIGFVAGSSKPELFFRNLLLRRGLLFALAAVPGLLRHPLKVLPRLLSALSYRGERPPTVQGGALLSSLGVHPNAARCGFGRVLVDAFCEDAARRGARAVYLTTDQQGNEAAKRFYERAGFRVLDMQARSSGRLMNTYVRSVVDCPDESFLTESEDETGGP